MCINYGLIKSRYGGGGEFSVMCKRMCTWTNQELLELIWGGGGLLFKVKKMFIIRGVYVARIFQGGFSLQKFC